MDPVKTSPEPALSPADFTAQFDVAAREAGFNVEPFGEIHGLPLHAYRKGPPQGLPRIYLSAGIHGDEPAPPGALLTLLRENFFDERASWFLCPLLNPTGFAARTRENHAGLDLNRDYRSPQSYETARHIAWLRQQPQFDFTVCLHEDWESAGFYLYELNPEERPSLAPAMLAAARAECPLETATIIDGRAIAEPGIIRPISDPQLRETWPESIYLQNFHSSLNYTTETPSMLPLTQRERTHCVALRAAINQSRL